MKSFMRVFRHFMHVIAMIIVPRRISRKMQSCREVAHMLANYDQNSISTKFQLKLHMMMCQSCYDYHQQLEIINAKCSQLSQVSLTDDQKAKINKSKEEMFNRFKKK
jgi:hypothetical protein